MRTLQAFKTEIKNNLTLLSLSENQIEFFTENGQIKKGSNKETADGLHFFDFEYRLALQIEEMKDDNVAILSLLVMQFVNNLNLDDNEFNDINFDVDVNELEKSVDVEITFNVRDSIYLVPVTAPATSPINIGGKMWGLGAGSIDTAETLAEIYVNH